MKTTIVLALALLGSMVALGIGVNRYHVKQQSSMPMTGQPYTLVQKTTVFPADGSQPWIRSISVRYQKSDGNWKSITENNGTDGVSRPVDESYGLNYLGVFGHRTGEDKITFISQKDHVFHHLNEALMRSKNNFLGERYINGLRCLGQQEGPVESWISVDLFYPILQTIANSSGGKLVIETVSVTLGEPTVDVTLPAYTTVNFKPYDSRIDQMSGGDPKLAQELRDIETAAKARLEK